MCCTPRKRRNLLRNNQENAAFPSGLCAERTTLFWVAANFPDVKVKKIFVVGGPKEFHEKILRFLLVEHADRA
jgi:cytidine deaminase